MCVNKKVLLGLGVAALAVLAFKPDWFLAALPLMVLALCPLSMAFMMRGMHNSQGQGQGDSSCGMGGKSQTTDTGSTDTASADPKKLDQEISALQAQLRSLKAAQAQRDDTATAEARAKVNFARDAGPDARA